MLKVKVPATSANIGGGFDCLGLAIDVCNEIYVKESSEFKIETDKDLPSGSNNLVYKAMLATFEYLKSRFVNKNVAGEVPPLMHKYLTNPKGILPIYMKQINNIPKTSGMGSSAACNVAGVLAVNELLGKIMTDQEVLNLCTKLDGHPDNVTPALYGGVTASIRLENGDVRFIKSEVSDEIMVNLYTPSFQLETRSSRKVLPAEYVISDITYSLGRAVFAFEALRSGNKELLKIAIGDKLHEPYRIPLVQDFESIKKMNLDCGALAVFLSGAGPSACAFVDKTFDFLKIKEVISFLPNNWKMFKCKVLNSGATVEEVEG